MQYFIKTKEEINPSKDLKKGVTLNDFDENIFGQKITSNQYDVLISNGSVKIQRNGINYYITPGMVKSQIKYKIKSYV